MNENFTFQAVKAQIYPAVEEDYTAIAEIYNEYIRLGNATMEERLHLAEDIQHWVEKFNDRERLFVLKSEERILGWGIIKRYSDRSGYRFACETAVYLTRSEMRKGYGSLMKKYLIKVCKQLNYKHLVAKIFASNEGSITYNLKLGYTIVGRQNQIGFRNGEWMDIVIMQYIID